MKTENKTDQYIESLISEISKLKDRISEIESKQFTLDDMKKACSVGIDICVSHNPKTGNNFKPFEDLINSLTQTT